MRLIALSLLALAGSAAATPILRSSTALGLAEGRCRPHEQGPAILIHARGLKDRNGLLRAELYPPDDADFLADDNVLLGAGKTFRRAEEPLAAGADPTLCIRAPAPGVYTLAVIHDRDGNRKFSLLHDGIGFPGNPRLGISKPAAASARIAVPAGLVDTDVILNYRRGFLSFGPLDRHP